ncbi:MAG TPA: hypothetical protein PLZ95_05665 [Bryobacteraceae bacterium]|nr:hypothetical protein [Bryobacteraceae bacterium]
MEIEADELRAHVEHLVHSKTFETSEVHRHLLHYLVEKTLSGDAERLKEYTVGLEAFGKPSSYDPRQDSIVRLQVGRLRQKLLAYYESEGSADTIRISLPKGAFRLVFDRHPAAGGKSDIEQLERRRRQVWVLSVALVAVGLWAVAASISWFNSTRNNLRNEAWSPELEQLWKPFLGGKRSVLVCLGAPLFVRFPNYGFFRDPRTNDWTEIEQSARVGAARKGLLEKEFFQSYSFIGTGEASAAFVVAKLLATRVRDLRLTRSNLLSWEQINDDDVVFLGPPKFNRQLQTAALTQDIVIEPDGIRNLKPRPGEPAYLQDKLSPGKPAEGESHALITRMPGPSGVGVLFSIAGNASPDTFAAAEWLTQPWRAKELVDRLRLADGSIPEYFQVVLKVEFKQGTPVQSSYVMHHVVQPPAKPARR